MEDYFSLIVHGDPHYRPLCPYCGSVLRFRGLRAFGGRGYNKYCNPSHQTLYESMIGTHSFQINRSLNEKLSSIRMKLLNKSMMDAGIHPLTKKSTISKRIYSRSKKDYSDKSSAILYVARLVNSEYSGFIKIGITSVTLDDRLELSKVYEYEYSSIHKLVEGPSMDIVDLENSIRETFLDRSVVGVETYEESLLPIILDFIQTHYLNFNK